MQALFTVECDTQDFYESNDSILTMHLMAWEQCPMWHVCLYVMFGPTNLQRKVQ